GEGGGDRDRDQHHPRDRADSEEQEVRHGPPGIPDRREDEQRDRSRPGEAVDDADHEWADDLVEPELSEPPVEPGLRRLILPVPVIARAVTMRVAVAVVAVAVRVGVKSAPDHTARGEAALEPPEKSRQDRKSVV